MATIPESDTEQSPGRKTGEQPDRGHLILNAALELLEEEGLDGLTIRSMLKRTGLARRAFYERFPGKDDLVLAVFETTLREGARYLEEQARRLADPLESMRMIVAGLVLGGSGLDDGAGIAMNDRRSAALSREHMRLAESRPAELQAALRPMLSLIAGQVAEGIRQGQFRKCDPDLQAVLIFNLVATTLHTELLSQDGGRSDRERRRGLAEDIWEFCRRAIVA
jgi:AcrR family transcriptional regulator